MFTKTFLKNRKEMSNMKGEKKFRFNGMDIFVVIVLAVVIAAGAYFLFGRDAASVKEESNVNVSFVMELTGKEIGYEDTINVGDIVLVGEKDKMRTTIENVEVIPAKTTGYNILDGKVLRAEVPMLNDIKVTLTAVGVESRDAIKINDIPVRIGQNLAAFGKGWSSTGYVVGLETEAE